MRRIEARPSVDQGRRGVTAPPSRRLPQWAASALMSLALALALGGCSSQQDFADLKQKMEAIKGRPKGQIEPPPEFEAYESFSYSAAGMRSPFQPTVELEALAERDDAPEGEQIKPDQDRRKEYLERFSIDELAMVGMLKRADGRRWVLIDDGNGTVHRVTKGNYLGRNHGKIVQVESAQIRVREIVPDGGGGWVKRPRTLSLEQ